MEITHKLLTKQYDNPEFEPYTFYVITESCNRYGWKAGDILFVGNDLSKMQIFNIRNTGWMHDLSDVAITYRKLKPGDSFTVTI
jgi:hypothetical protein